MAPSRAVTYLYKVEMKTPKKHRLNTIIIADIFNSTYKTPLYFSRYLYFQLQTPSYFHSSLISSPLTYFLTYSLVSSEPEIMSSRHHHSGGRRHWSSRDVVDDLAGSLNGVHIRGGDNSTGDRPYCGFSSCEKRAQNILHARYCKQRM